MAQPHFAEEWCHPLNVLSTPTSAADHYGTRIFGILSSHLHTHQPCFPSSSLEPIIIKIITFWGGGGHFPWDSGCSYSQWFIWSYLDFLSRSFTFSFGSESIWNLTTDWVEALGGDDGQEGETGPRHCCPWPPLPCSARPHNILRVPAAPATSSLPPLIAFSAIFFLGKETSSE